MRSADTLSGAALLLALCLAVSGCSSVAQRLPASVQAAAKSVVEAVTPAAASASAPAAAVPQAPTEPEVPVSPMAQRTFDDALRALRAGRTDEAERGFMSLTQSHPQLGGPFANLGVIYRQAGKLPESAKALEEAVRVSPRQAVYFNQLGITYRHQGQFAKAREAYEQAISLDAGYASPLLNLGILHDLYLGDARRALELYDRYLALSPAGDATVTKWIADLKNRKPAPITVSQQGNQGSAKEKE
jgi:Flp pilus assembly protein TadD